MADVMATVRMQATINHTPFPDGPLVGYTDRGIPIECPWCNQDHQWAHIPDSTSTICDTHYQLEVAKISQKKIDKLLLI